MTEIVYFILWFNKSKEYCNIMHLYVDVLIYEFSAQFLQME